MLWSIDSCQNKVSRARGFFKLTADQMMFSSWSRAQLLIFYLIKKWTEVPQTFSRKVYLYFVQQAHVLKYWTTYTAR